MSRLVPSALLILFLSLHSLAAQSAPVVWQSVTPIAEDDAVKGPWKQNDSRYDYVDDGTVALADDGHAFVAWVNQDEKDAFVQRVARDGRKIGAPVDVSRNPGTFSWLPRIALAPHDPSQVFVLWQEILFTGGSHGGDVLFARSLDGGKSFTAPLNLSGSSRNGDGKGRITPQVWHNGSLDLAVGADGAVYAAWTDYEGHLWLSVSSDRGATFTPPRQVAGTTEAGEKRPARAPSLAIAPDRKLYLAWTHGGTDDADIHVMRSTDGGASFGHPVVVARTPGYSDAPKLAADPRGTLHLAFGEAERGPFTPKQVMYTRSRDGARGWDEPRPLSPPGASYPSLAVAGPETVVVVWESSPVPRARPRGLAIAVSRDGGVRFAQPELIAASIPARGAANAYLQGRLTDKLGLSPRGALAVVNSSFDAGQQSRVWLVLGTLKAPPQAGGISAERKASASASGVR